MSSFLQSLKNYVRFSDADTEQLNALLPHARPHFQQFAANFYDRIEQHPDARRVFDGPAQVARLKLTLMKWMRSGLKGPHDEAFYERRSRIGRMHVAIGLPQQYMFTAMNVVRVDFQTLIAEVYRDEPARALAMSHSLNKLLDIELAIMLHTYQEDTEARVRQNVRMATIGQIAADISDELRQPLGAIRAATADLAVPLDPGRPPVENNVATRRIQEQVDACEEIIGELLSLHGDLALQRQRVDILALLGRAQASVELPESIPVELSCDAGLTVDADPHLLQYGVGELLRLLIDAHGGRLVRLRVSARAHEDDQVAIDVVGQGAEVSHRLDALGFASASGEQQPAFRLERAVIEAVATRHGGTLEVLEPARGPSQDQEVAIRLRLPRVG